MCQTHGARSLLFLLSSKREITADMFETTDHLHCTDTSAHEPFGKGMFLQSQNAKESESETIPAGVISHSPF